MELLSLHVGLLTVSSAECEPLKKNIAIAQWNIPQEINLFNSAGFQR